MRYLQCSIILMLLCSYGESVNAKDLSIRGAKRRAGYARSNDAYKKRRAKEERERKERYKKYKERVKREKMAAEAAAEVTKEQREELALEMDAMKREQEDKGPRAPILSEMAEKIKEVLYNTKLKGKAKKKKIEAAISSVKGKVITLSGVPVSISYKGTRRSKDADFEDVYFQTTTTWTEVKDENQFRCTIETDYKSYKNMKAAKRPKLEKSGETDYEMNRMRQKMHYAKKKRATFTGKIDSIHYSADDPFRITATMVDAKATDIVYW